MCPGVQFLVALASLVVIFDAALSVAIGLSGHLEKDQIAMVSLVVLVIAGIAAFLHSEHKRPAPSPETSRSDIARRNAVDSYLNPPPDNYPTSTTEIHSPPPSPEPPESPLLVAPKAKRRQKHEPRSSPWLALLVVLLILAAVVYALMPRVI